MKHILIRQNQTRLDPSKKARPPPGNIAAMSMNYTPTLKSITLPVFAQQVADLPGGFCRFLRPASIRKNYFRKGGL